MYLGLGAAILLSAYHTALLTHEYTTPLPPQFSCSCHGRDDDNYDPWGNGPAPADYYGEPTPDLTPVSEVAVTDGCWNGTLAGAEGHLEWKSTRERENGVEIGALACKWLAGLEEKEFSIAKAVSEQRLHQHFSHSTTRYDEVRTLKTQ